MEYALAKAAKAKLSGPPDTATTNFFCLLSCLFLKL